MNCDENLQQKSYTLLFPFELKEGEEFTHLLVDRKIGNLTLTIEQQANKYILRVEGFKSEQDARNYVNHLWSAFAWSLVNTDGGMPFNASLEFGQAFFPPNPRIAAENLAWSFGGEVEDSEVIDVIADGDLPVVYQADQEIKRIFGGSVDFKRTRNFENFVSTLEQLSTINISNIIKQPKLKIALELYNSYFYEKSDNARFVTLIMVLETLTTHPSKHQVALDLIEKWKVELISEQNKYKENSEEYDSLSALERELLFRKEASLSSQIRTLILNTLTEEDKERAFEYAKQIKNAYNLRGKLVHDGWLPSDKLSTALEQTKTIVIEVLKAKLREAIN